MQTDRDGVVADILRLLFFAVNWPSIANQDEQIKALIKSGYEYNFWTSRG